MNAAKADVRNTNYSLAPKGHRLNLRAQEERWGYLFILPWLLGFIIFSIGPIITSLYLSLTSYDILSAPEYVGFENYRRLFTTDISLANSVRVTLEYAVLFIPLALIGSLLFAVLLNRPFAGRGFIRLLFYLPYITPIVATAYVWQLVLNPQFGPVNTLLTSLGITPPGWFNSSQSANFTVVLFSLWAYVGGGPMVVFLSALQAIPRELYEAARIDGANGISQFRHVTVPMLSPTIFYSLILAVVGSFQVFDVAYVVTQGGPGRSTMYYMLHLFRQAFSNFDMGYASALAWTMAIVLMVFTAVQFLIARRWVYYETDR